MNTNAGSSSAAAAPPLTAEAAARLQEGISIVLSRWTALQMAVLNEWGGPHSNLKSQQVAVDLFSKLTQSKEKVYIDDLEDLLYEAMDNLGAVIEDGSVEEIALELMEMHEGCQGGDFSAIDKLKATKPPKSGAHVLQATSDSDDDVYEDSANGDSSMVIDDAPQPRPNVSRTNTADVPMPEAEDGWTVVAPRRNRDRRN